MTINPFEPSTTIATEKAVSGNARLIRSGFLYRAVEFDAPRACRLTYSGWWFVQRVWIDGEKVWGKVSWLDISRIVEFSLPRHIDPEETHLRIEITFRPGLIIRRFRVWMNEQLAFDQIN